MAESTSDEGSSEPIVTPRRGRKRKEREYDVSPWMDNEIFDLCSAWYDEENCHTIIANRKKGDAFFKSVAERLERMGHQKRNHEEIKEKINYLKKEYRRVRKYCLDITKMSLN